MLRFSRYADSSQEEESYWLCENCDVLNDMDYWLNDADSYDEVCCESCESISYDDYHDEFP